MSLEWWTNISDTVAVVEVAGTKKIAPLNEYWQSQEVRCIPTDTLKGDCPDSFTFRQDYRKNEHDKDGIDAVLGAKKKVLLFYAREAGRQKAEIVFWVNLSRPDTKLATHAPYNNQCEWLENGEAVLALVKARIEKENPGNRAKKRGVIIPFTAYEPKDMYWDFVRTADPEFKPTLIKQLRDGDEESAIYNLISYPGKDTRDLIRPFLKDERTSELQVYDDKDASGRARYKTVKIYPLRQAAYSALNLLGESTEKPEGYYHDPFLWLFAVGFEHRTKFPHGDWKRVEKAHDKAQQDEPR